MLVIENKLSLFALLHISRYYSNYSILLIAIGVYVYGHIFGEAGEIWLLF